MKSMMSTFANFVQGGHQLRQTGKELDAMQSETLDIIYRRRRTYRLRHGSNPKCKVFRRVL